MCEMNHIPVLMTVGSKNKKFMITTLFCIVLPEGKMIKTLVKENTSNLMPIIHHVCILFTFCSVSGLLVTLRNGDIFLHELLKVKLFATF